MNATTDASEFRWVGNHPGLDLVNTQALDAGGDLLELVPDWAALVEWAEASGVIDAGLARQCRAAEDGHGRTVLSWFRRLRLELRQRSRRRSAAHGVRTAGTAAAGAGNGGARRDAPRSLTDSPLRQPALRVALLRHDQEPLAALVRHGGVRQPGEGQRPLPADRHEPIRRPLSHLGGHHMTTAVTKAPSGAHSSSHGSRVKSVGSTSRSHISCSKASQPSASTNSASTS
jgi:hypothetical protein